VIHDRDQVGDTRPKKGLNCEALWAEAHRDRPTARLLDDAISSDASRPCFRADHMLIESQHSMAREDRDGSQVAIDVITTPPTFFGKSFFRQRIG